MIFCSPSIQQSVSRASPAVFALSGGIFTCAASPHTFALFAHRLSLTEDYFSCQYFNAVGGESSPPRDDTPDWLKTRALPRDCWCMSPTVNQYERRIRLKNQCPRTVAIRGHVGRVSLGQSRTFFCSTDKVSFHLVPKWTAVFKTWTLSGEKKSITSRLKWHSSRVRRPHNVSEVAVFAYALWLFNQCTIYIFTITTVAWSNPECARCTLRLHGLE